MIATAFLCLALNVFYEARGEPLAGQNAVAQVTLNRAAKTGEDVCSVVTERRQFSWTIGKIRHIKVGDRIPKRLIPDESNEEWRNATEVARLNLRGKSRKVVGDATSFHTLWVSPKWRFSMRRVAKIGSHVFYAEKAKS